MKSNGEIVRTKYMLIYLDLLITKALMPTAKCIPKAQSSFAHERKKTVEIESSSISNWINSMQRIHGRTASLSLSLDKESASFTS